MDRVNGWDQYREAYKICVRLALPMGDPNSSRRRAHGRDSCVLFTYAVDLLRRAHALIM